VENPNQLNTLFEGAARVKVSYWTLYRGIEAGVIKGVRLGGRIMISNAELAHIEEYGFGAAGKRNRKCQLKPTEVHANG